MFNKRVIFILFVLIIALGALSSVNASDAPDGIISDTGNDEMGIYDNINDLNGVGAEIDAVESGDEEILESSDDGTFTALQNKINKASEGSTISLDNDYYYNSNFGNTDGVKITKSITINGNGHAISGSSKSCLLQINGTEKVIINNVIFKNGKDDDKNPVVSCCLVRMLMKMMIE